MNRQIFTIPFIVKTTTEKEIIQRINPQLLGTVKKIMFKESDDYMLDGQEYKTVVIEYEPWFKSTLPSLSEPNEHLF